MTVGAPLLLVWLLGVPQAPAPVQPPPTDLAAVKALYLAASYEEALEALASLSDDGVADEADVYRALCELALGRPADAERALQVLVTRDPLYELSDGDVSPRLVTMYHDVRHRLLPDIARDLYKDARASMTEKRSADAARQLTRLLAILNEPDATGDETDLADLKLLAQGFLDLVNTQLADEARAAAAAKAAAEAAVAEAAQQAALADRLYSPADGDVTPPVEIERPLPEWLPPNVVAARQRLTGVIRVVIDRQGQVESASVVQPTSDAYDAELLVAARTWRFQPARLGGQPVRYVEMLSFVLSPRR